ncbi:SNF5-domain-containing protein [Amniculicola lignicola CBS 123094]|uniref:SNF5-domain-containing protein n=1 Tax=Amniculicola lignicola CBS 123094 TaxID=1392246 RepID=A0A6A5X4K3_9PLEO|nr:SNF5-domain-containing protein [Amniculicola lignicola CBS 123094]
MPSPATSHQSATPDSLLDSALHHPQGASPLQNGVNREGAVQQPPVPASVDGPAGAVDENSSIREGKQKAKAVLAASGLSVEDDTPTTLARTATPAPADAVNGGSPSRKRSRSGSRKPSHSHSRSPAPEGQDAAALELKNYLLEMYTKRDLIGSTALLDQLNRSDQLLKEVKRDAQYYSEVRQHGPAAVYGQGFSGYGNGWTDVGRGPPKLQYPFMSKRAGNRRSRPIHIARKDKLQQAEQVEELVPVRLDIELDKIKLRDTFTWNLHDRVTPTEVFAENLVEDFKLPFEIRPQVIQHVAREMQEQIQDYYPHAYFDDEPLDPILPYSAYKNDEMRILIKLNITIGQHTLVDQFEWEINNVLNSPEEFARQMACDLSLSGEFTTAIAHSIREQCQMFTKSLYITGHPFDGRPVEDTDIKDNFLPSPLPSVFRPMQSAKDYTPYLYELNEVELERAELSILREQRRQKRSVNRRGGPALPDLKDRQRTVRSLIVSSVLPGAAETIEESHIFKISRAKKSGGRARGGDGDESSDSDSDDSLPESPAPSQLAGGTARTRNMRGAATAAQIAMRNANVVTRSATPEIASLAHHHETRTSSRQLRYDVRDESASESATLLVKLRISRPKLQEFARNPRAFRKPASTPLLPSTPLPVKTTPSTNSMPPPPSPAMPPRSTPVAGATPVGTSPRPSATSTPASSTTDQKWNYYPDGRTDAPFPAQGNPTAPPPPWLKSEVEELQKARPNELFEIIMRYTLVNQNTGSVMRLDSIPGNTLPAGVKAQFLPRLRCMDCPGKLYTPGPDHTVDNFKVHLKHRTHRENVERRTGRTSSQ